MTYEEKAREFWWCAKLIRQKGDKVSFKALETLQANHHLPAKLNNRVIELRKKYAPANSGPDGPPLRTA